MPKEESLIVKICDIVMRVSLYAALVLIPIFFAPWSSSFLDLNKQILLTFLVFISLFAWMAKILVLGKLNINIHIMHAVMGIFLLIYIASTIFSVAMHSSFWGWPLVTHESLLSVVCFFILYFLVSNTFTEKEIFSSFLLLSMSSLIVLLYGILQMIGLHIVPFAFAKTSSFNTIGSLGAIGLFAVALLFLCIIFATISSGWKKVFFIANIPLIFITLILINYSFIWWLCLFGSALILSLCMIKKDILDGRWLFLPMFFIIISLFFIIFNPQIKWLPQKSFEVSLSQKTSAQISLKALKSFPILGSGPGTFVYDFMKYKDKDFNKNSLWNTNFNASSSKFLTNLANLGGLGLLALVLVVFLPIFYGILSFFAIKGSQEAIKNSLILGILTVLVTQSLGYFLYNSNISLDFIYFFCIGALVAIIASDRRTYILKPSSSFTLITTFAFTVVFIFGLGFLFLNGQRYFANIYYYKASLAFQDGKKDDAIRYLKIAANNNQKLDLYFSQLAVASLSRARDQVSIGQDNNSKEERQKNIERLISDSINAATIATNLNSKNADNWAVKAYVCKNLIGLVGDAADCAIKSYDQAIQLSPTNPYLLLQKGNAYLAQGNNESKDKAKKDALLSEAKNQFNRAVELKQDYSLAYLQLALIARAEQKTEEVILMLQTAAKYSLNDAGLALQIGLVYLQDRELNAAQAEFQRALSLIPNYANAMYYSGITYDRQGQKSKAIETFAKLLVLNPDNKNIQNILDNLRAGKPILDGLIQQPPSPNTSPADTPPSVNSADVPAEKK